MRDPATTKATAEHKRVSGWLGRCENNPAVFIQRRGLVLVKSSQAICNPGAQSVTCDPVLASVAIGAS